MDFPGDTPEAPLPFVNMTAGPESGLVIRARVDDKTPWREHAHLLLCNRGSTEFRVIVKDATGGNRVDVRVYPGEAVSVYVHGLPERAAVLALLERLIGVLRALTTPPSGNQRV